MRDHRMAVAREDDLTLLGHLEAAVDRSRRLAEHRAVRRPAAPTERATATVEQRQRDAVPLRPGRERALRVVQRQASPRPARRPSPSRSSRASPRSGRPLAASRACTAGSCKRVVEHATQPSRSSCVSNSGTTSSTGGRPVASQERRKLEHAAMSAADVVKLMTYRRHASTPYSSCMPRMRANRLEHLAGHRRHARRLREPPPSAVGVHAAVLPNLELGEVKTKRLRLPDQMLQLTERQPMRAGARPATPAPCAGRQSIHRDAGSRRRSPTRRALSRAAA